MYFTYQSVFGYMNTYVYPFCFLLSMFSVIRWVCFERLALNVCHFTYIQSGWTFSAVKHSVHLASTPWCMTNSSIVSPMAVDLSAVHTAVLLIYSSVGRWCSHAAAVMQRVSVSSWVGWSEFCRPSTATAGCLVRTCSRPHNCSLVGAHYIPLQIFCFCFFLYYYVLYLR